MNRVALTIVGVLACLWGLPSALSALLLVPGLLRSPGVNTIFLLINVAWGCALLTGGVMLLRHVWRTRTGQSGDASDERGARTGARIVLVVLGLAAGLAGLLFSICGVIIVQGHMGAGGGLFILIGAALLAGAIALFVGARRVGRGDS